MSEAEDHKTSESELTTKGIELTTGRTHRFTVPLPADVTLRMVANVYKKLLDEDKTGLLGRRFLLGTDYDDLEKLARKGVSVENGKVNVKDPENDPNLLDERVILLWGMRNDRVKHTQEFLKYQDYLKCPQHGVYDDETKRIHDEFVAWRKKPKVTATPAPTPTPVAVDPNGPQGP